MKNYPYSRFALTLCATLGVAALVAALAIVTSQAISQDKDVPAAKEGEPPAEKMAAMMEAMKQWQALASPGEHHKHLETFVGTWDLAIKMWMGGPGAPATESEGTSTVRWVLGKRFLLEEMTAEMNMGPLGRQAFEGLGLSGYDNYENMYVNCWADSVGTQLLTMRGTRHPKTGVFTAYGTMDEPALDMQDRMVKYVTRVINKDTHVFEMYDLPAGDDYRVMEITYTRRK